MPQPIEELTPTQQASIRGFLSLSSTPPDSGFDSYDDGDSPVTLTTDGRVVYVDATSGDVVVNLPPISEERQQAIIIKRVDTSLNGVTIQPSSGDSGVNVEGGASVNVPGLASVEVRSNTSHWWVISLLLPGTLTIG